MGRRQRRRQDVAAPGARHGPLSATGGRSLRLVFAGTPDTALPSLRALLDSRHEVVAVLTRPDAPAGRGRRLTASPVAALARDRGVPTLTPRTPKDPEFIDALIALAPDCCPVVAYGALVPRAALDVPSLGWVNLHFSLLPSWRGAAPVQHAILAGDEITGATTFVLEEGLDTGPVLGVVTEPIRPTDTSGELLARLSVSGARLLGASIDGLADGDLRLVPQPDEGVSIAPKLGVDDVRVDWSAPAVRIDRLVRAATPAPGAWTNFRGHRLKLRPVTLVAEPPAEPLSPGALRSSGAEVLVGTGSGPVRLGEVQPEGKPAMAADAWTRGVRLTLSDVLA